MEPVESAQDIGTREVLACDDSFFSALLAADHDLLGMILADDFLIVGVSAGRLPLFCDTALAERIERAEAQLVALANETVRRRSAGTAGFVIPIAGGVASFAEEGSPFNKVGGLGFGGAPGAAALDEI